MQEPINILGIKIDKVDLIEAREIILNLLEQDRYGHMVVTPNPEIVMKSRSDPELTRILNQADLGVADGIGLVLAARILDRPLPERVAGFDLMQELLKQAAVKEYSVYFLGGKPEIVNKAVTRVQQKYQEINICGSHHGYLNEKEIQQVITDINKLKPELLFVGMGVPLQEKFLAKYLEKLDIKVAMTVGGSFDVLAGIKRRAPYWWQQLHLEWLYRLLQEPSRWRRILVLPVFMLQVLITAFTDK